MTGEEPKENTSYLYNVRYDLSELKRSLIDDLNCCKEHRLIWPFCLEKKILENQQWFAGTSQEIPCVWSVIYIIPVFGPIGICFVFNETRTRQPTGKAFQTTNPR